MIEKARLTCLNRQPSATHVKCQVPSWTKAGTSNVWEAGKKGKAEEVLPRCTLHPLYKFDMMFIKRLLWNLGARPIYDHSPWKL